MKKMVMALAAGMLTVLLCACGSPKQTDTVQTPISTATQTPEITPSPTQGIPTDDPRGIPGMKASTIKTLLNTSFGVPLGEDGPAFDQDYAATSCTSYGEDRTGAVSYDYSISIDSDGEIIGASFGISSINATGTSFLQAADLYLYAVGLVSYDTADSDALTAWIAENLETVAGTDGVSTTIGDAMFELYGLQDTSYWIDISSATT